VSDKQGHHLFALMIRPRTRSSGGMNNLGKDEISSAHFSRSLFINFLLALPMACAAPDQDLFVCFG